MRKISVSVLLILPMSMFALYSAGCSKKNELVGKWNGNISARGMSVPVVIDFTEDGKETETIQLMGQSALIQGTYVAKDGTLTQTLTSATFNGRPAKNPMGANGKSQTATYKVEGDTLTLTPSSGQSIVLTRQKS